MGHHRKCQILVTNPHLANSREHVQYPGFVLTTLFHPSKPSIRPISHLEEELSFGVIDKKITPILEEEKLSPGCPQRRTRFL